MPSVLVTGASRGIGRSIVTHLASQGWDVIAGVRSERDGAAITAVDPSRISSAQLDITKTADIDALAEALPARLDAVVNNAGVVTVGPLEALAPSELRNHLEVNAIGHLAVTQTVLPLLRRSRGRIVFVSSINGKVSLPMLGAYSAAKFALEAIADALRVELRAWNIRVSLIEPAQTQTDMWHNAEAAVDDAAAGMSAEHRDLYARHLAGLKKSIPRNQALAKPPQLVADAVAKALTARRPRARYVVGVGPRLQVAMLTNLPTAARDLLLHKATGLPDRC
jgi:NAD(P)-dependent dehydrogenase (short-subunit alcohol dehydrogenase family)